MIRAKQIPLNSVSSGLLVPLLGMLPIDRHAHNRYRHHESGPIQGRSDTVAQCIEAFMLATHYMLREVSHITFWSSGNTHDYTCEVLNEDLTDLAIHICEYVTTTDFEEYDNLLHIVNVARVTESRYIATGLELTGLRRSCDTLLAIAFEKERSQPYSGEQPTQRHEAQGDDLR